MLRFYYYTDEWGNWALVKAADENEAWGLLIGFFDYEPRGYDVRVLDRMEALAMLGRLEVPCYTRFEEVWEARWQFESGQSGVIFGEAG